MSAPSTSRPDHSANATAEYYQNLHDDNPAYLNNNWLLEELDDLRAIGGASLLEVGCGNGRFLELAAPHWELVIGVDWAKSPLIEQIVARNPNVRFDRKNVVSDEIEGNFDVVASADFLEHLAERDLPEVMTRLLCLGRVNYHKIACYDDGHSHLSILPPDEWCRLWHSVPGGDSMRLIRTTLRKGKADKAVIVLSNSPELLNAVAPRYTGGFWKRLGF